jgi:alkylation response protein AidB-like acyl-CoA dehydrogenase
MTMNFERSSIGFMMEAKRNLEDLLEFCKGTKRNGRPLSDDPMVRSILAQLVIEVEVGIALSYKVAWLQEKVQEKGMEMALQAAVVASSGKVYGSELGQRLAYAGCRIMGLFSQVKSGSRWAPLKGRFESSYQECVSMNMGGGTSEIMRNVIALRGLEMPRST